LFIHKILISSTCFEPQVLIFRRIQLYTCSKWYCHSLWEFLVACRYTAWVRTDCPHSSCVPTSHQELSQRVTVPYAAYVQLYPPEDEHLRLETCSQSSLKLCTYKPPGTLTESDSNVCCICTTVSSWRWALEARNM